MYLFNGDLLGLRQQEEDEARHDEDQSREEQEDAVFQMAERRQEALSNERREEHIHTHHNALPRWSRLQREQLARDQPPQRAPRSPIGQHEYAYHHHQEDPNVFGKHFALPEFQC